MQEKYPIDHYKYPQDIVTKLLPIISLIKDEKIKSAEKKIAYLALDLLERVENKILTPKKADKFFTLLDIYIGDNFSNIAMSKRVNNLIYEGMILHDLNKSYGADVTYMKSIAKKILSK